MTTREAFEAQIRKQFPTANEELLLGKLLNGRYVSLVTEHAWQAWQAAKATCPAWQDAPTVPGLWVVDEKLWRITKPELHEGSEDRWLGPLPEDKS